MPGNFKLFSKVGTTSAKAAYPQNYSKEQNAIYRALKTDKNVLETFDVNPTFSSMNAATNTLLTANAAAAQVIPFHTRDNAFEYYVSTINGTPSGHLTPYISSDGLEIPLDADVTNGVTGVEITSGILSRSRSAFTVGTSPKFFLEVKVKIDDISDLEKMWVGFRKAEAYQADPNSYDELCAVHIGETGATVADGYLSLAKILNNAATVFSAMGNTAWADADEKTIRLEVDSAGKCLVFIDGVASTNPVSHTFDAGEVVVPFIQVDNATGSTSGDPGVSISSLAYGTV